MTTWYECEDCLHTDEADDFKHTLDGLIRCPECGSIDVYPAAIEDFDDMDDDWDDLEDWPSEEDDDER